MRTNYIFGDVGRGRLGIVSDNESHLVSLVIGFGLVCVAKREPNCSSTPAGNISHIC